MSDHESHKLIEQPVEVPFPPKSPIRTIIFAKNAQHFGQTPSLIFTHGAGGTLQADAVANFAHGFARQMPIMCFHGNMNLKSRVKMFQAVCEDRKSFKCLGGRSMGARAAVIAATDDTQYLILVSYPLHTNTEARDQILLDLPERVRVLFMSGDNDTMCEIGRLEAVRKRMKCKSWLCVVKGADHGMNMKPKAGTTLMGHKTGEVAATWLEDCEAMAPFSTLVWNPDAGKPEPGKLDAIPGPATRATASKRKRTKSPTEDHRKAQVRASSRRKRHK